MTHDPLDDLPQSEKDWAVVKMLKQARDATGSTASVKVLQDGSVSVSFATSLQATPPEAPKQVVRRPSGARARVGRNDSPTVPSFSSALDSAAREVKRTQDLYNLAVGQSSTFAAIEEARRRTQDLYNLAVGQSSTFAAIEEARRRAALWTGGVKAAADSVRLLPY